MAVPARARPASTGTTKRPRFSCKEEPPKMTTALSSAPEAWLRSPVGVVLTRTAWGSPRCDLFHRSTDSGETGSIEEEDHDEYRNRPPNVGALRLVRPGHLRRHDAGACG